MPLVLMTISPRRPTTTTTRPPTTIAAPPPPRTATRLNLHRCIPHWSPGRGAVSRTPLLLPLRPQTPFACRLDSSRTSPDWGVDRIESECVARAVVVGTWSTPVRLVSHPSRMLSRPWFRSRYPSCPIPNPMRMVVERTTSSSVCQDERERGYDSLGLVRAISFQSYSPCLTAISQTLSHLPLRSSLDLCSAIVCQDGYENEPVPDLPLPSPLLLHSRSFRVIEQCNPMSMQQAPTR